MRLKDFGTLPGLAAAILETLRAGLRQPAKVLTYALGAVILGVLWLAGCAAQNRGCAVFLLQLVAWAEDAWRAPSGP